MASTRNKNTPSDYCLQQRIYKDTQKYNEYKYSQFGQAYDPAIPCLGYTPSHMPWNTLSHNPVDIESTLFGIGSTNLVNPQRPIEPELKSVPMKSYFNTLPLIMPKNLIVRKDQRPFPIPN